MTGKLPLFALVAMLASCTPQGELSTSEALSACKRQDVQDVVGKEARNMMLKANEDQLWRAAFLGIDLTQAMEQARVSFGEVGVYAELAQSPYTQIICEGSMQIDGSSAQAGQDIVTIPHLRWSINFAEPTTVPESATFTIAIDPVSLTKGLLVNGQMPEAAQQAAAAAPAVNDSAQATNDMSETDGISEADAARAAAEAAAEAKVAATIGDDPEPSSRQPTDEDLYAPHSN